MCNVPDCASKHHTLLHSWVQISSDNAIPQPSVNCAAVNSSFVKTCLGIIPVTVMGGNGHSCQTYALLDDGADKTLCDERLVQQLQLTSRSVTFKISTNNSTGGTIRGQEVDLSVSPISGNVSRDVSNPNLTSKNMNLANLIGRCKRRRRSAV